MIPASAVDALLAAYPAVASMPAALRDEVLARHAVFAEVPAGAPLFDEGAPCRGFPLVLGGEVRVARGAPQGRALELYRVAPGEVCVVSASCLFGTRMLQAHGVASAPTQLVLVDPAGFDRWCTHAPFRTFVFGDAPGLADICLVPQVYNARRLKVPLDGFPRIVAAEQACLRLPAFDKARPENQPDAE